MAACMRKLVRHGGDNYCPRRVSQAATELKARWYPTMGKPSAISPFDTVDGNHPSPPTSAKTGVQTI